MIPICVLNCLFAEQKASQIMGCLCFQTVTREEGWAGLGWAGPGGHRGHLLTQVAGRDHGTRWGHWSGAGNDHTDIYIMATIYCLLVQNTNNIS